jgi:DNA helicase II / ATP-dependent DNA helicase PcrA
VSKLLEGLNEEQLKAVTHTDGPLLIVAGAGTGKTTVITRRIAYLLEQKLAKPEEILALTFTDKAAGEMEERVDQLLPLGSYDLWISTFHSFCERILKQHALDIGVPNDFELLDDTQQWVLVHKNFEKFKLVYYRPLGSPNKFIDALLSHFSKCKDEVITPESYLEYAQKLKLNLGANPELFNTDDSEEAVEIKRIEEVASAYHTYQKLLLDNNYLDFGDLINYTLDLFKKRPNILKLFRQQFKYVMVDEFQDTNFAQYELVKLLTNGADGPNLVVVGDDDQSIYKFRGASVSNILKLKEDYPNVTDLTLVKNYRSSQEILDLAYDFIQANNPNRLEVKLKIKKKLINPLNPPKAVIRVLEGKDLSEELNMVVKTILELKVANPDSTWNDFAILIRANAAADEILPRLDSAGISYMFVANRGLFKKPLISDLIAYMKLLANYHDSSSLYRALNFPKFRISQEELSNISQHGYKNTLALHESLKMVRAIPGISEEAVKRIEELLHYLKTHSDLASEKTAVEVFVQLVQDLGVSDDLSVDTLENAELRELLEQFYILEQFYKKIESFEERSEDKSLRAFLATLDLELLAGNEGAIKFDPNVGPEALKVLTIHSAKGLEFNYVFIVNMLDQRFPTRAHGDTIKIPDELVRDILPEGDFHLQEERRLFYVALTRAKTHLYLSWGRDYGGAKLKKPSSFLQETNLVPSEKVSQATGKVVFTKAPKTDKQTVYKQLPTSFSFTDVTVFQNCPLEYKFRYYLRLPMPGTAQLSFGKSIHAAFEKFGMLYQQMQNANQQSLFGGEPGSVQIPEFKKLEELYEQEWIGEWYATKKQKEEYYELGKKMLKVFYDDIVKASPNIAYIEKSFSLKVGEFTFRGKIDRIDRLNGGVGILDYKTGNAPKKSSKDGVDQLRIYQWAAEEFLHEKVEALRYWYLKDSLYVDEPLATPDQLLDLQAKILQTIHDIREAVQYDTFAELHTQANKQHMCGFENLL